jgi:hypothetical protein
MVAAHSGFRAAMTTVKEGERYWKMGGTSKEKVKSVIDEVKAKNHCGNFGTPYAPVANSCRCKCSISTFETHLSGR